jgi:hypothetical protein
MCACMHVCMYVCMLVCTMTQVKPYTWQPCHLSCNFPAHCYVIQFYHSEESGLIPGKFTWDLC